MATLQRWKVVVGFLMAVSSIGRTNGLFCAPSLAEGFRLPFGDRESNLELLRTDRFWKVVIRAGIQDRPQIITFILRSDKQNIAGPAVSMFSYPATKLQPVNSG